RTAPPTHCAATRKQAGGDLEQRGFARAVGADEPDQRARRERETHLVQAVRHAHANEVEGAHAWRRSIHRKNGPPTNDVTMPTRSPPAARPSQSHATTNPAPPMRDSGTSRRCSGPTMRRSTCGTINP